MSFPPIVLILTFLITTLALVIALWRHILSYFIMVFVIIASAAVVLLFAPTNVPIQLSLMLLGVNIVLVVATWLIVRWSSTRARFTSGWVIVLLLMLITVKIQQALQTNVALAWIGISYLILRLIHVSIESKKASFQGITLAEMIVYTLHPATLIAGPIDRVQHSVEEQHQQPRLLGQYIADGTWRILLGLFKKLVIANILFIFVDAHSAGIHPISSMGSTWLWLIANSFYIYFDFAGYSDIAIGIARLTGMKLPENFTNPYSQSNLAQFWQHWHITFSNWLRDYIFYPVTRTLLKRFGARWATPIAFVGHLTTMIFCGLWHGFGTGFLVWGIWHGLGLFVHSQMPTLRRRWRFPTIPTPISVFLTFSFVTLGWLFFTYNLSDSFYQLRLLLGMQP